ncbi:hypothetical protein BH11PSE11_BH11PSE11_29770 [soil metagenome]
MKIQPLLFGPLVLAAAACAQVADAAPAAAANPPGEIDYLDLSMKDLLSLKLFVPAALTQLTVLETPAATTVITAEDIRLTPARNIYDLIEVYVPGAFWMNHEQGPHLGLRGNIAGRNYKYLLVVNGRVMNNKAYAGARSELEMWDLSDIERIEVVSGPGSVTYGAGAVAGVISITTRKPSGNSATASVGYLDPYRSRSATISRNYETDAYQLFAHASIVKTDGVDARAFQVTRRNEAGFVGQGILPGSRPLDYFADFNGEPQVKLHLELDFAKGWHWWTRYTQQGSTWYGNETKTLFNGALVNEQGLRDRQFTTTLENKSALNDKLTLSWMASYGSYDFERRTGTAFSPDLNSTLNTQVNFAESSFTTRGMLNWKPSDRAQIALGMELSHDRFGPGWSDDVRDMRIGESGEIVNGPNSNAILSGSSNSANRLGTPIYVGDGWSTNTLSVFSEANLAVGDAHKLLLSGRADKNTYTNWMFSPRLAWISTLAEGHVLKFSGQRSVRMNTAAQLLSNARSGINNDPEKLDSLEIRYSAQASKALGFNASAFHNSSDVVGYQTNDNTNRVIGQLKLNGIEGEVHYDWQRGRIGANFSWVKQQDWQLAPGVTYSSVSYAGYQLPISGARVQQGYGNALNNWPDKSIKLFANYRFSDRVTLHADARWFSSMQGALDGLQGLNQAIAGSASETPEYKAALARIAAENTYGSDFRVNALLEYADPAGATVQLYAQNLLGRNGKRYAFDDAGNGNAAARRVRFTEEPAAVGVRFLYRF